MQIKLIKVYYCRVFTVHINTYNVTQSLNFINTKKLIQKNLRSFITVKAHCS